jgi:hypothetical protein
MPTQTVANRHIPGDAWILGYFSDTSLALYSGDERRVSFRSHLSIAIFRFHLFHFRHAAKRNQCKREVGSDPRAAQAGPQLTFF